MKSMKQVWGSNWKKDFSANNLNDFEALWDLKTDWFEPPNIRRGGWSGVVKITLDTPQGKAGVFIKRQQNHTTKTICHPIKGIATFQKEFHNIERLSAKQIPTLELIYFAQKETRSILITKELENYHPLDSKELYDLTTKSKRAVLLKVAQASAKMHYWKFQHNCFYPKHIFVKKIEEQWDVRFIDLEKLKRTIFKKQSIVRDLLTLYRHADNHWTTKDRLYFFKCYVNEKKLSTRSKRLWHTIEKKLQNKRKSS